MPGVMAPTMMSISLEVALLTASSTAPTLTTGLAGKLFPKMLRSPPVAGSSLGSTESIVNEAVVVVVAPVVVVVTPAAVVVVLPLPDVVVVVGGGRVVEAPCPTEG